MMGREHTTVSTRRRIFATHSCGACFVAGEPGDGDISRRGVGGCAAGGHVSETEWGRAGTWVQAAGGCGRGMRRHG